MTDLIERLCDAIFRQEGRGPTHPNPGGLRGSPWLKNQQSRGGFWLPASRKVGVAGAAHLVALRIAEGHSLATMIRKWAPSSDGNPTEQYIKNVAQWAEIPDVNQPLWEYLS